MSEAVILSDDEITNRGVNRYQIGILLTRGRVKPQHSTIHFLHVWVQGGGNPRSRNDALITIFNIRRSFCFVPQSFFHLSRTSDSSRSFIISIFHAFISMSVAASGGIAKRSGFAQTKSILVLAALAMQTDTLNSVLANCVLALLHQNNAGSTKPSKRVQGPVDFQATNQMGQNIAHTHIPFGAGSSRGRSSANFSTC